MYVVSFTVLPVSLTMRLHRLLLCLYFRRLNCEWEVTIGNLRDLWFDKASFRPVYIFLVFSLQQLARLDTKTKSSLSIVLLIPILLFVPGPLEHQNRPKSCPKRTPIFILGASKPFTTDTGYASFCIREWQLCRHGKMSREAPELNIRTLTRWC